MLCTVEELTFMQKTQPRSGLFYQQHKLGHYLHLFLFVSRGILKKLWMYLCESIRQALCLGTNRYFLWVISVF